MAAMPTVEKPVGLAYADDAYKKAMDRAHVQPRYPETWHYPHSANPENTFTLLNKESPEYIRFVNPSDLRVAREACGACHQPIIQASERSLMATGAMLWGGASYNNGILPFKRYILGEAYTRDGQPASLTTPVEITDKMAARGVLPQYFPLPRWETTPPADVFRVFERGGRNIVSQFPEVACPTPSGAPRTWKSPAVPTSASPTAARAPACVSPSRSSTSTRRGSTTRSPGSSAPTTIRAISAPPAAARAMSSTPTTATRATRGPTRSTAIGACRSRPIRRFPRTRRATRSSTSSPAPSRRASA